MGRVRARRVGNALLYTEGHRDRIVDAVGRGVWKYQLRPDILNADGTDPTGWTTTVVEVGAGTTDFSPNNVAGRLGSVVPAANENDGGSYQLLGENVQFDSNQLIYAGMEFQGSDIDQSDLFFGMAIVDTALLGGVTDAVYFESLDGSAAVAIVAEKDSTETTGATTGTLVDAVDSIIEFLWDGTRLKAYVDGTQIYNAVPANVPDDEDLRLSLEFLTGEAVANTLNIKWLKAIAVDL